MPRNYKQEYDKYQGSEEQKKNRAARNKARRAAIRDGKASKGDGKDIDHKKPLRSGGSKDVSNTRVRDKSANRSDNGHTKGEKHKKW
jgi:hypothetical protein